MTHHDIRTTSPASRDAERGPLIAKARTLATLAGATWCKGAFARLGSTGYRIAALTNPQLHALIEEFHAAPPADLA